MTMQTSYKEMHFFSFFEVVVLSVIALDNKSLIKSKQSCVKRIHLVTQWLNREIVFMPTLCIDLILNNGKLNYEIKNFCNWFVPFSEIDGCHY